MATRVIDDAKLQNIAVAIQAKDNGGQMTVDEMPDRIDALPTGGTLIPKTITENGVYNATDDNADGYDIVTVDVPEKNTLDDYFANTLEVANIPSAVSFITSFFQKKDKLKSVNAPNVRSIPAYCFHGCENLETIILSDRLTAIHAAAFGWCKKLVINKLPNTVTVIQNQAFYSCISIPFLDFSEFNHIPTINSDTFYNTTFPFYFRDQQQLDEWAAATNWSVYADRFQIKPSGVI